MTVALAIALGIIGLVLGGTGVFVWRHEQDGWLAAAVGVPGAALLYAGVDFIARTIA